MLDLAVFFGVCAQSIVPPCGHFTHYNFFLQPQLTRRGMHSWFTLVLSPSLRNLKLEHREGISELGTDDSMP